MTNNCYVVSLKKFSLTGGGSEETPRLLSESVQSAETRCGGCCDFPQSFPESP